VNYGIKILPTAFEKRNKDVIEFCGRDSCKKCFPTAFCARRFENNDISTQIII
jgi:hypothetical protein